MVAGWLMVLAVVEAAGRGRGGGVSPELAAGEFAGVGEDNNGGRRREGEGEGEGETLPRRGGRRRRRLGHL
jgi:hypothetical protein